MGLSDNSSTNCRTPCFVSVVAIVLFLLFLPAVTSKAISVYHYFDLEGIIEVAFVMIFSLCFAGRFKDFCRAFIYLYSEPDSRERLRRAIMAVSLAEKSCIIGGAFCSIFYVMYVLFERKTVEWLKQPEIFALNMGVSLVTLFYGMFGALILMPVKSRLESRGDGKWEQ